MERRSHEYRSHYHTEKRSHERRDRNSPPAVEKKGHKRKLADADGSQPMDGHKSSRKSDGSRHSFRAEVREHVDILKRCISSSKGDRTAARRAASAVAELAMQEENISTLVDEGAISALVPHLRAPFPEEKDGSVPYEHEVEKYAACALGLVATKDEYQTLIVEAGALSYLVSLLYRKANEGDSRIVNSTIRRAADAIANLSRNNSNVQKRLRMEGAIAPLEVLVESSDHKVRQAAADALKALVKREEEKSLQTNGSLKEATDSDQRQQDISTQDKIAERVETMVESSDTGDSSRKGIQSSGLKGLSLKSPEALAKAKLALEKQKMLAEKLKKLPQVNKASTQSSATLSAVSVSTSVASQTESAKNITTMSTAGVTAPLPSFPGMSPLASVETLKKVQEITARFGIPQTTESIPFLSMIQKPPAAVGAPGQRKEVKGPVLRLDAQGREIDENGNLVEWTKISNLSTLKVNIDKHKRESFQILHPELEEEPTDDRFYDADLGVDKKKLVRPRRPSFQFIQEGSYAKQAELSRMKSRFGEAHAKEIKMKQAALAKAKAEPDINPNLIEVSERFIMKEKPKDPLPEVEWWDILLLPSGKYHDVTDGEIKLKMEKLTIYVEHPVPIEPPAEPPKPPPQPLKLTKKEQKKLRTQRRLAREKDKQEMIRQGLLEPPKQKVKMSNLMKVLGAEATQDPTKLEMEIRSAAAEREQAHIDRNLARKLTPAERFKKKERKLFDDPSTLETIVSVYKVTDLSHVQTRFKVDVNAQENRLTGCIVMCDSMTLVIVEGGSKPIKRYKKLMLQRIKWASAVKENDEADADGPEKVNKCVLVWQGSVAKPSFEKFTVQQFRTEAAARKYLGDYSVGHYWDLATNFMEE